MEFIVENWYIILAAVALVAVVVVAAVKFFKLPTKEQIAQVKAWLLWAVTEAEKELGGGTGQLKLRKVYDLFVQRFPWLAKVITFERFSVLVDEALDEMREMLAKNKSAVSFVAGAK